MKAMILAAGLGERLRPLTEHTPKPLIKINGQYLIEYSLHALAKANYTDIIINLYYLGDKIKTVLGNGERYGLNIHYSEEDILFGAGGGIAYALPLLGDQPFIVLSADVITNYPLENLPDKLSGLAHLVLVENPNYHTKGDFYFKDGLITSTGKKKLTFGNIGIYHPSLFKDCKGNASLTSVLKKAIENKQVTGELFQGQWTNIGTQKEIDLFLKGSG